MTDTKTYTPEEIAVAKDFAHGALLDWKDRQYSEIVKWLAGMPFDLWSAVETERDTRSSAFDEEVRRRMTNGETQARAVANTWEARAGK